QLERVLPDGSCELIINLREEPRHIFDSATHQPRQGFRRSWFSGPHSRFIVIDTARDASLIGAHFKPGGASEFFGAPLHEMRNSVIELDAIWNGKAQSLRDQLLDAPGAAAKFDLFELALIEQWNRATSRHRAISYALTRFTREPHTVTIGKVTEEIGLSARRFIEVFAAQVGMTPKVFCRVQRFQRALTAIQQRREVIWTQVALDCGYYDQAHFIQDFKEFCGLTPGDYLNRRPEYMNFVPIDS
ncbi:MAG TPA: helix-turn-helix domain-containing protein, partial [Chthoniobacterales bacterium]|nr:helix-turn-helix domain-containing protein [Chthoniobacterales bacterium]